MANNFLPLFADCYPRTQRVWQTRQIRARENWPMLASMQAKPNCRTASIPWLLRLPDSLFGSLCDLHKTVLNVSSEQRAG
ncbi:hypothetical protein [Paraburkholderia aspalathi]|uniref:hypothetical protein n=1 Tax=Paraburkholderia aspalathi TaxID=1324617 RepID=UPI0021122A24|nr:hypothetical protein [Paraburkholderia sediminicola]